MILSSVDRMGHPSPTMATIILIFLKCFAIPISFFCLMWFLYLKFVKFQHRNSKIVWNVSGLNYELQTRVRDQVVAVRGVVRLLRGTTSRLRGHPQHRTQVVFLLGGPGVGKSLILDILMKHVKIQILHNIQDVQFITKYMNGEIEGRYTTIKNYNNISGTMISIIELNTCLEYFIKKSSSNLSNLLKKIEKDLNRPNFNDKSIIFVTGPLMTVLTVRQKDELQMASEYDAYVDGMATELNNYMYRHVPNLHASFIKLKPIDLQTFEEVVRVQRLNPRVVKTIEQQWTKNQEVFDEEFVLPRGCKTEYQHLKLMLS